MSDKDIIPPAFPVAYGGGRIAGMTLRDYFAARAMDGVNKCMVDCGWDAKVLADYTKQAYIIADAMLKARK
jgi:hypothetical protein